MSAEQKYSHETLTWIRFWAPHLFSFRVTRRPNFRFTAGQFARLGLQPSEVLDASGRSVPHPEADSSGLIWRAYSIASETSATELEFFCVAVPGGAFSSVLSTLKIGDSILVDRSPYGFLTTARFAPGEDLWMLATGTGLGPFLSILRDPNTWDNYRRLIVVHSVRLSEELAYRDEIAQWATLAPLRERGIAITYVPVVTRELIPEALHGRIPLLLETGALEQTVGLDLDKSRSRVMLCGNPAMVEECRNWLTNHGFATPRRQQAGSLAVENYW